MITSGPSTGVRPWAIALLLVACAPLTVMGGNAHASREGCLAFGPDSSSCSFVEQRPSTLQVVAVGAQYWEVDIINGSFVSVCAFGRVGAAIGQCSVSAGSTIEAFVRQGVIIVQRVRDLPATP